jgi:hypothetical protein
MASDVHIHDRTPGVTCSCGVPNATITGAARNLLELSRAMELTDADADVRVYTSDGCGGTPKMRVADLKAYFEDMVEELLVLLGDVAERCRS